MCFFLQDIYAPQQKVISKRDEGRERWGKKKTASNAVLNFRKCRLSVSHRIYLTTVANLAVADPFAALVGTAAVAAVAGSLAVAVAGTPVAVAVAGTPVAAVAGTLAVVAGTLAVAVALRSWHAAIRWGVSLVDRKQSAAAVAAVAVEYSRQWAVDWTRAEHLLLQ